MVSVDPAGSNDHPSRDAGTLASRRLSLLLALEIIATGRAAADRDGIAGADPADEHRESTWGAPRIHGELLKLGFAVAQSSVAKYMVKRRGPPSQGWCTFLHNHAPDIAAMDLFAVPTIGFKLLYAFVIVRLNRRDLVWINVTTNPNAEWVARQITEAFPWNEAPRYMLRDRDRIYAAVVIRRLRATGIRDKPVAPASPWQNGFAERLIGSIRRECLDHVIVGGEAHLCRILRSYAIYYNPVS
jgi:transposase InsO family protein